MSVANRRVSVIVEGNSTSGQAALDKMGAAMDKLGKSVARNSQLAIDYDKKVIASNDAVIASYNRMLATMNRTSSATDAAVSNQTAAQGKLAGVADSTAGSVTAAADRQVTAMRASTIAFDDAVKLQTAGLDRVATAATDTSDVIARAAEKQATAMSASADMQMAAQRRAAQVSRDTTVTQSAGLNTTGMALTKLGKAASLGFLGIAAGSVYMATKFESSTTRLLTQAGATTKQVGEMRKGILNMAGQVGQSPEHLSEGLYHVVSSMNALLPAATRTTEELKIQKVAAEGAAVGHTNLEETTYALASAMNALHLHVGAAEGTMGTLNAIVGAGDMTMNDLLDAMKSGLIPTARTFGISLASVGSALAVMGDQGIRGALAGTRLRMSLALLAAPSKKAAEMLSAIGLSGGEIKTRTEAMSAALEKAGLTTTKMAEDLRQPNGLSVAFKDLDEHLRKSGLSATDTAALLSRAFGGGRMGATIMLLAQSTERLDAKYRQIQETTHNFNKDWEERQKNIGFQALQLEAKFQTLGIRIGTDLLPPAKELVGTLKEVVEWFEKGSAEAHALEYTIGSVLAVAIVSYGVGSMVKFANSIKNAYTEYGKLQGYLRSGFGSSVAGTAVGGATTATASSIAGSSGVGGIWGVKGASMAGSMMNPIVVAVEGGQYAGLGSRAAAGVEGTAAASAAEGAAVSKGGVILPPGPVANAAKAEAASVAAAAPSIAPEVAPVIAASAWSNIKGSIAGAVGPLIGKVMKGGMIAILGSAASEIAGGVIGGKAGKDVGGIGGEIAKDAGFGTLFGPAGTIAGAFTGALEGGLKTFVHKAPEEGDKWAHGFVTPFAPLLGAEARKHAEAALAARDNALKKAEQPVEKTSALGKIEEVFSSPSKYLQSAAGIEPEGDKSKRATEAKKLGREEGELFKQAFGEVKAPTLHIFAVDALQQLDKLQPSVRMSAAKTMIAYASELEKNGMFAKGSVDKLIKSLEGEFPQLKTYLEQQGRTTANAFESALDLTKAEQGLKTSLENINRDFGITMGTSIPKTMQLLEYAVAHSTGTTKGLAEKDLKDLNNAYGTEWNAIKKHVESSTKAQEGAISHLSAVMPELGKPGFEKYEELTQKWVEGLTTRVGMGIESIKHGVSTINKTLETELSSMGVSSGTSKALVTGKLPTAKQFFNESPFEGIGKAHGGPITEGNLIQVGKEGEKGRDSVPFVAGGVPIITAPGEKIAVFTHQQQAVANQKMADIGGLSGLFSSHKQPNHMATGGWVRTGATIDPTQGQAPTYSAHGGMSFAELLEAGSNAGRRPDLTQLLGEPRATYGMPMETSILIRAVGSKKAYRIFKNDVGSGQAGDTHYTIDLHSAIASAIGFPDKGDVEVARDGTSPAAASAPGGGGVTAASIKAPNVHMSGVIGKIAQGAVNKATAAANKLLEKESAKLASTAGPVGGASGGGISVPAGGTKGPLHAMIEEANRISSHKYNYEWGGGHGAIGVPGHGSGHGSGPGLGFDCSGAVSAILHAGGLLGNPMVASAFGSWGLPGPGKSISIFSDPSHVFMELAGHYFGTSSQNPGGGADWISSFPGNIGAVTHPAGFAKGGQVGAATTYAELKEMIKDKSIDLLPGMARGGLLAQTFATGGKPSSHTTATKNIIKKSKGPKPKTTKLTPLNTKGLDKLLGILGLVDIPNSLSILDKELEALSGQESLMESMASDPRGFFVTEGDMQYIKPTLVTGQDIHAGMNLTDAQNSHRAMLAKYGESETMKLQEEYLSWIAGQPSHRMLTSSDMGILSGTFAGAHLKFKPGSSLLQDQIANLKTQINVMGSPEYGGTESGILSAGMRRAQEAHNERHKRDERLHKVMETEYTRYKHIKGDIQALTTGSLKSKVAAAKSAYAEKVRTYDANQHIKALQESIAQERLAKHPDKEVIAKHEAQIRAIKVPKAPNSSSVTNAQVALLKNELTNELHPIEDKLRDLGGSSTTIGTTGRWGRNKAEGKIIGEKQPEMGGLLETLTSTKIPQGLLSLRSLEEAVTDAPIPMAVTSGGESESQKAQLLEQENEILSKNLAVSQAQYAVMSNFAAVAKFDKGGVVLPAANLPHFEKGGPIIEDGPIYAHKGEHVVPVGGALVAQGSGPPIVHLHHETHVHGNARGLVETIDSRVQHPQNVQAVSRQISQRKSSIPTFRGRG